MVYFTAKYFQVTLAELRVRGSGIGNTRALERERHQVCVGATRDRDASERVSRAKYILERERHRAHAGPAA
jgi:hypothetical protein